MIHEFQHIAMRAALESEIADLTKERDSLKANVKTAFDLECVSQRTISSLRSTVARLEGALVGLIKRVEDARVIEGEEGVVPDWPELAEARAALKGVERG